MQNGLRNVCADATGGGDQSLMILQNEFFVDPRVFAVHTFGITKGSQFNQVLITLCIFCEQHLVKPFVFLVFRKCFATAVFYHVEFTTYDRFYF
jgi:hypothetical protein